MSDRVPLEMVTDASIEKQGDESFQPGADTPNARGLDELREMHDFSLMLGFSGSDFGGLYEKAMDIYKMAKGKGEEHDPLLYIKNYIRKSGMTSRGKTLLIVLHRMMALDSYSHSQGIADRKEALAL